MRTIYRDIQDLSLSGVPVEGEAGVGYHLRYSLDIPPLMFTAAEIEALVVRARMLKAWGGSERHAIAQRRYLRLNYQRADHESSQREVKPLGLFFWGNVWTLTAWCELRNDFRAFRLDRIGGLDTLERSFEELPGQTLGDFIRLMRQSECY
ncbi:helix-turn-helix transcriptional regulator [Thiothrix subterranea]|uniref:WYL domain-containing protein n=1 Tax=Thiothrix subterranea TaxID=2735563 RepID=A0AA51MQ09_9GAMM|nr:WYL domain-containing protein [Thiothrix subterranea]MDQ5766949.1 WYL domain-containing protein [Thiothrix subterranea]WML88188.1 WYL domain-containing protein [Thiothrix subterranea]